MENFVKLEGYSIAPVSFTGTPANKLKLDLSLLSKLGYLFVGLNETQSDAIINITADAASITLAINSTLAPINPHA